MISALEITWNFGKILIFILENQMAFIICKKKEEINENTNISDHIYSEICTHV